MLALFTACLVACAPTTTITVAGDSVILTVAIADDLGPQTVSVDSLYVTAGLGQFGSDQHLRLAKVAGGITEARFAFPRSAWTPGATLGSTVRLLIGHVDPGCPNGICWSTETVGESWSYTDGAVAPNPAPAEAIDVQSVDLN